MTPELKRECVEWTGPRNRYGYGVSKRRGNRMTAHRRAWIDANGPIPLGSWVLHRCNNRGCVNVNHLYLGSARDNRRDAIAAGTDFSPYRGRTHCKHGHEYTPENTRMAKPPRGRVCRTCERGKKRGAA